MQQNVYRLSHFFAEVQATSQDSTTVLDIADINVNDRHIIITQNTSSKVGNQSPRVTLEAEDIIIQYPGHLLHILHINTPMVAPRTCTVLRKKPDIPTIIPPHVLPLFISRTAAWVQPRVNSHLIAKAILNEIIPPIKNEAEILPILQNSQKIMEKCRLQIEHLQELQKAIVYKNHIKPE